MVGWVRVWEILRVMGWFRILGCREKFSFGFGYEFDFFVFADVCFCWRVGVLFCDSLDFFELVEVLVERVNSV